MLLNKTHWYNCFQYIQCKESVSLWTWLKQHIMTYKIKFVYRLVYNEILVYVCKLDLNASGCVRLLFRIDYKASFHLHIVLFSCSLCKRADPPDWPWSTCQMSIKANRHLQQSVPNSSRKVKVMSHQSTDFPSHHLFFL